MRSRRDLRVRPKVVGLAITALGLGLVAILWWARLPSVDDLPHRPAHPWVRVGLGAVWASAQLLSLLTVYLRGPWRGALASGASALVGIAVMATGRAGLAGLWTWTTALHLVAVAGITMPLAWWVGFRQIEGSRLARAWSVFAWLALTGCVYLLSASASESSAQLMALLAGATLCGIASAAWPWLQRLAQIAAETQPLRLSIAAWVFCIALLIVNGVAVQAIGLRTPQVPIGPISIAPYFLAAALAPSAFALNVLESATRGWRAFLSAAVGLPIVVILYAGPVNELGTLAVIAMSLVAVLFLAGTPGQALAGVTCLALGIAVLSSPLVVAFAAAAPRAVERIDVWAGRVAPPAQLGRVIEAVGLAGLLGHAGAARMQFLVGSEVGKDYMLSLVLANGGWIGLVGVVAVSACLLLELHSASRRTASNASRALLVAVFGLVLGNLIVTTLWAGGLTPFVGVPLPVIARSGSHLIVLAAFLLVADLILSVTPREA